MKIVLITIYFLGALLASSYGINWVTGGDGNDVFMTWVCSCAMLGVCAFVRTEYNKK